MKKILSLFKNKKTPAFWNSRHFYFYLLSPLSFLYRFVISCRKFFFRFQKKYQFPVPIIIVGNITVGGTGKTPLVIWLANFLKTQGYNPGIVSRGYGGKSTEYPLLVNAKSNPENVGDEALVIQRHTNSPLVVDSNRVNAAKKLLTMDCNVIISDDGLQHYALERDIEIAVIDGEKRFGNGLCLPAGPLREPLSRLKHVDFIITNGIAKNNEFAMKLMPDVFRSVSQSSLQQTLDYFKNKKIHAVAGIGNPSRFFNTLRSMGLKIIEHPFPDHYFFERDDLNFENDSLIIMTEKDAVKCEKFSDERFWYLPVRAEMSEDFGSKLMGFICRTKQN